MDGTAMAANISFALRTEKSITNEGEDEKFKKGKKKGGEIKQIAQPTTMSVGTTL